MEYRRISDVFATKKDKLLYILAVFLTIVACVVIFAIMTSAGKKDPTDNQRMADMQTIALAVRLYAGANNGMYPESLSVLVSNRFLTHEYVDPVTRVPYRYMRSEQQTFSICATISDGSNRCISSQTTGENR